MNFSMLDSEFESRGEAPADTDDSTVSWRNTLLARCETAIRDINFASVDFSAQEASDPPSFYEVFSEIVALRSEQKRGNRKFSDVLVNFTSVLESLQEESRKSLSLQGKATPAGEGSRSTALALIDLRDRLHRILAKANDEEMAVVTGLFKKTSKVPGQWHTHSESLDIFSRYLNSVLDTAGLEQIATEGLLYDPKEMKAVSTPSAEALESLRVIAEISPGYRWQGQCLRPAEVEVAAQPPSTT